MPNSRTLSQHWIEFSLLNSQPYFATRNGQLDGSLTTPANGNWFSKYVTANSNSYSKSRIFKQIWKLFQLARLKCERTQSIEISSNKLKQIMCYGSMDDFLLAFSSKQLYTSTTFRNYFPLTCCQIQIRNPILPNCIIAQKIRRLGAMDFIVWHFNKTCASKIFKNCSHSTLSGIARLVTTMTLRVRRSGMNWEYFKSQIMSLWVATSARTRACVHSIKHSKYRWVFIDNVIDKRSCMLEKLNWMKLNSSIAILPLMRLARYGNDELGCCRST